MSAGLDEEDRDLTAAEYVIGTLDRAEREAFAARLDRDAEAQRSVAAWETRLAGLTDAIAPIAPPPDLWPRIERALSGSAAKPLPFAVIEGGGRPETSASLTRSRNRWRAGAILSGVVAAALALTVARQVLRGPHLDDATYVAAVNRGGDQPALIVSVNFKTGQVVVRPVAASAPSGHSLELWYIGHDKTPRSMGIVDRDAERLSLPRGTAPENATFAVSVEPSGGSKTGGPTGPVVYAGQLIKE